MAEMAILTFPDGRLQAVQCAYTPSTTVWQAARGGPWLRPNPQGTPFVTGNGSFGEMGSCADALGHPLIFGCQASVGGPPYPIYVAGFEDQPTATPGSAMLTLNSRNVIFDLSSVRQPDGRIALFATQVDGDSHHVWGAVEATPNSLEFGTEWTRFNAQMDINANGVRALTFPSGMMLWALSAGGDALLTSLWIDTWTPWTMLPFTIAGGEKVQFARMAVSLGRATGFGPLGANGEYYYPVYLFATENPVRGPDGNMKPGHLWTAQTAIDPGGALIDQPPVWSKFDPQGGESAEHLNVIPDPSVKGAARVFVWYQNYRNPQGLTMRMIEQTYASDVDTTPTWSSWRTLIKFGG